MTDFFDKDLVKNLFSEAIGIILTVILIPIVLKIVSRRKTRNQRFLTLDRLLDLNDKYLIKLLPKENIEYTLQQYSKRFSYLSISTQIEIIDPENVNTNLEKVIENKIENKTISSYVTNNNKLLKDLLIEIKEVLLYNANYLPNSIFKELHKLLYNLRTTSSKYNHDDVDFKFMYVEDLMVYIRILSDIRKIILLNYPKREVISIEHFFTSDKEE